MKIDEIVFKLRKLIVYILVIIITLSIASVIWFGNIDTESIKNIRDTNIIMSAAIFVTALLMLFTIESLFMFSNTFGSLKWSYSFVLGILSLMASAITYGMGGLIGSKLDSECLLVMCNQLNNFDLVTISLFFLITIVYVCTIVVLTYKMGLDYET